MDQIIGSVGSFWVGQNAKKEFGSVEKEISALTSSIEGGTKKFFNKMKGNMQKPLPDLLKEYDLAVGIFPKDATNYEFNEQTKKLTVHIPTICEVTYRDQSMLRFSTTVTGHLEKGKLSEIEGLKTKFIFWITVTCITSEETKLHFSAGINRPRDRHAYDFIRDAITVDNF